MLSIRAAVPALLLLSAPAFAQPRCHAGSLEQLGREVAAAFTARSMAGLAARLPDRPVSLVIEHSLNGRHERATIRLRSLVARLDRAAGPQGPRGRHVLDGMACSGATCRFGPSGILHNTLFLKEVVAVRQGGCLTVGRIRLIDGD